MINQSQWGYKTPTWLPGHWSGVINILSPQFPSSLGYTILYTPSISKETMPSIHDKYSITETDSFSGQVGQASEIFKKRLAQSKITELSYSLVHTSWSGNASSWGDFSDLSKLFPTTLGVEVFPPYLRIQIREFSPKSRSLTIDGLPVQSLKQRNPLIEGR